MANIEDIKKLREETGASPNEIKKALEQSQGHLEKAKEILRMWGKNLAGKKTDREAMQGIIETYIHPNSKTGVLLDIRCETDFVAKSPDFKKLAHEICLQIAAMKPLFVKDTEIPSEVIEGETRIYNEQLKDSGKPENIVNQVLEGKIKKYKESISLMDQPWVKDDSKTIKNLVEESISKIGENIEIRRFARFEI